MVVMPVMKITATRSEGGMLDGVTSEVRTATWAECDHFNWYIVLNKWILPTLSYYVTVEATVIMFLDLFSEDMKLIIIHFSMVNV